MKSRSIQKVLAYLDLSMRRCVQLYKEGDAEEVEKRLAMLESICERTLKQIEDTRRFMVNTERANEEDSIISNFKEQLGAMPTASEGNDG